jgi:L-ascorbate metabolism protein UlaG (beta-lactamase superfamily)
MTFTWLGGAGYLLQLGPFRIAGDPVAAAAFEVGGAPVTRIGPAPDISLAGVDALCLTCTRADHYDPEVVARVPEEAFVLTPAGATVPDGRELAWFESMELLKEDERLTITAVPARSPSGDDNGWFFRREHGDASYTACCTGDALWSDEIRRIQRELGYANLLIQHIGAEGGAGHLTSPDGKEAMQFVYRMQPNAVVAVHHTTFSHYTEGPDPFAGNISRTIYEKRLQLLGEGDTLTK